MSRRNIGKAGETYDGDDTGIGVSNTVVNFSDKPVKETIKQDITCNHSGAHRPLPLQRFETHQTAILKIMYF